MRACAAVLAGLVVLAGCARGDGGGDDDDGTGDRDGAVRDGAGGDGAVVDGPLGDGSVVDARVIDARPLDAAVDAMTTGVIDGGPCLSGAPGATAYRIRWTGGGGTAQVVYEVHGLPDPTPDHAGAYGYQIGFTPQFVDVPLGGGGLLLDGSSFVDLELSTMGVAQIMTAKLSIFGRSYNTTASGSFNWQSFDGVGASPVNLVSNVAPYRWYTADMTAAISPGDGGVRIRIKAGPNSGALAVSRIELCMQAF